MACREQSKQNGQGREARRDRKREREGPDIFVVSTEKEKKKEKEKIANKRAKARGKGGRRGEEKGKKGIEEEGSYRYIMYRVRAIRLLKTVLAKHG